MCEVSPVIVVEQWDENWAPVFSGDEHALGARELSEPGSDMYLSGTSSRKRRFVRQSRPPTTLDGFMNESLAEAGERAEAADPREVRGVLRESVRSMLRARASGSGDYDPARFVSAAAFIEHNANKTHDNNDSVKKSKPQDSVD